MATGTQSRWYGATVSEGTHRPQDIIPAFVSAASDRLEEMTFDPGADAPEKVAFQGQAQDLLGRIERHFVAPGTDEDPYPEDNRPDSDPYWESEEAGFDLEELCALLDTIAPEGCAFEAHEGDGACFGFWPFDDGRGGLC